MKKLLLIAAFALGTLSTEIALAQDSTKTDTSAQTEQVATTDVAAPAAPAAAEGGMHYVLKQKFMEGGWEWMAPILLCMLIGLAIVVERIIYLNLATVNTDKLLKRVDEAMDNGGIEAAKEICRTTRGPVASIFYQGLDRAKEGLDIAEKSIVSYGSVQMGRLESGLIWIALFIALAPMLGFLGTVVGMIQAFDAIEIAGDISPSLVAGGIKVALITTVGGLIVAMILQVFYNYLVSKVDSLVNTMEDSSISLMDILVKHSKK